MARWHSCNVFQSGSDGRRLWEFDGHSFALRRELSFRESQPLPSGTVAKDWKSLYQPRLNIALLPSESVFIRAVQLPRSSPEEIRSMVELQLEKLSPIPVTQAVWSMHLLPAPEPAPKPGESEAAKMQTVIVAIAARNVVEEFLGRLEGQGYLADRLEVPALDQLQATVVKENGAWIYPEANGRKTALVAWWYAGVLHHLALLSLPAPAAADLGLKDQLMQMAWGGELEGWLTSPPAWHLVAEGPKAQEWEPLLREALDQPVEVVAPLSASALVALTARRAAQSDPRISLLPTEFADRYRQQFRDRLWMRGLGAALVLYVLGCVVYFVAVGFLRYQCGTVDKAVKKITLNYTNAMQRMARYGVLKERQELKFAALDCWEQTAELLPEGVTLESMNFSDGKKFTLSGTAPGRAMSGVTTFSGKLRKVTVRGQPLFNENVPDDFSYRVNPRNATVSWSFGLQLKRTEAK